MLKKSSLFLTLLSVSICAFALFSCSKRNNSASDTLPSRPSIHKISGLEELTPGELHNLIVECYADKYGFEGNLGATRNGVIVIIERMKQIGDSLSLDLGDDSVNLNDDSTFVQLVIADLDNIGLFDEEDATKDILTINGLYVSEEPNSDFKDALTEINGWEYGGPEFLTFASSTLSNLSLSGDDLIRRNGYEDILGHSTEIVEIYGKHGVDTKTQKEIDARIANADALGWKRGFNQARFFDTDIQTAFMFAGMYAAACSSIQAAKEQW